MRQIEWSRRARRDLERMRDYWFDRDPEYVQSVLTAAERAANYLSETPAVGSLTDKAGMRKWRAGKSRYLLLPLHELQADRCPRAA